MKVRPATAQDGERCTEISPMRSAEELVGLLDAPDVEWLVVESDAGAVAGIGIIHFWPWQGLAWVWDLTVDQNQRGKGCGTALLKGMIDAARRGGARVFMDFEVSAQTPLARLYLSNGFRICGTNDRWFTCSKDSTAVFYGYDL